MELDQINALAGNNAAAKALGGKSMYLSYDDNGRVSFVESNTQNSISERGQLSSTGHRHRGYIAFSDEGTGMFVFKQNVNYTTEQSFRYKNTNSLRRDKDGYLSTKNDGTGYKVYGYKYDPRGKLPQVTSLLSELVPVNIRNIVSNPKTTTKVLFKQLILNAE